MMSQTEGSDRSGLVRLAPRDPDAHKGDFGTALIIGGSLGMTGAVGLAGMSALRGGAGLVRLAMPDVCLPIVAAYEPSYMTVGLSSDRAGRISLAARSRIETLLPGATVVACGPGLGRSLSLNVLVGRLYRNVRQPMVVDADGLNALAAQPEVLASPGGPRILTPHPGEFARLTGTKPAQANADRVGISRRFAAERKVVLVLKGASTVVAAPDGRVFVNPTGNSGLATGGTGDVLTGLIAGLMAQGMSPLDAACAGVYLHGLAADIAVKSFTEYCLAAGDLPDFLSQAFAAVLERP